MINRNKQSQPQRTPLLSEHLLRSHDCYIATDNRFRRACRMLAALWLRDNNIATGLHIRKDDAEDIVIPISSLLSPSAARAGRNFLTADIHTAVRRDLLLSETGSAIDEQRLFSNSLSSDTLARNLIMPLVADLDLGTKVFRRLLPNLVHRIHEVRFETAPARRHPNFLNDGTAFDAAIEATDLNGGHITIFAEMKFTEDPLSCATARHRSEYDLRSRESRLFVDPDSATLRNNAHHQLWRLAMLSQRMVDVGLTPRAHLIACGPRLNRSAQVAFRSFADHLIDEDDRDDGRIGFTPITLEDFIEAIAEAGNVELSNALWQRYCDFGRLFEFAMQAAEQEALSNDQAFPSRPRATAPLVQRTRRQLRGRATPRTPSKRNTMMGDVSDGNEGTVG